MTVEKDGFYHKNGSFCAGVSDGIYRCLLCSIFENRHILYLFYSVDIQVTQVIIVFYVR